MGTVAVVHGCVLWEWLIACWMGTVAVVQCLLDGYCGMGTVGMVHLMGTVAVVDCLLDGYCSSSSLLV